MMKNRYVPVAQIPIEFFLARYSKTLGQINGFAVVQVEVPYGAPRVYITRGNHYWLRT